MDAITAVKYRPLKPGFGAEILDIDLNRADEAGINPATTERPLSFDGDAEAINLTAPPNPLRASVLGRRRSRLLRIYHQLERHRIRCRCRARTSRPATSRL